MQIPMQNYLNCVCNIYHFSRNKMQMFISSIVFSYCFSYCFFQSTPIIFRYKKIVPSTIFLGDTTLLQMKQYFIAIDCNKILQSIAINLIAIKNYKHFAIFIAKRILGICNILPKKSRYFFDCAIK